MASLSRQTGTPNCKSEEVNPPLVIFQCVVSMMRKAAKVVSFPSFHTLSAIGIRRTIAHHPNRAGWHPDGATS